VPLVGYVSAGAATTYFQQDGQLDEVPPPDGASEATVAVEIRGDSLGSFFDRWLVFYDDVRRPVTNDLVKTVRRRPRRWPGFDQEDPAQQDPRHLPPAFPDRGPDFRRRDRVGRAGEKHGAEVI
jgi:hypothetical protein